MRVVHRSMPQLNKLHAWIDVQTETIGVGVLFVAIASYYRLVVNPMNIPFEKVYKKHYVRLLILKFKILLQHDTVRTSNILMFEGWLNSATVSYARVVGVR